jgi:SAM-dependent methyltransferase
LKIDVEPGRAMRERELDGVVPFFPAGAAVLEIGAGAGWQAKALSALGFKVEAIDVPDSNYVETRVWPVQAYDGTHIPFEDARFDVVFSSNVLEHVKDLEGLEKEIHRTLKPGGTVIHVLPTPSWRAWTTLAHYPAYATLIARRLATSRTKTPSSTAEPANTSQASPRLATGRHGVAGLLRSIAVPARHGEIGNALSELYHFSSLRWRSHFQRSGWRVEQQLASRVFYTGYSLFGQALSLEKRSRLSAVLGSACTAYVLRSAR